MVPFMQQQVWNVASQMAEAQETIKLQKLTVLVFIHLIVAVSLWFLGKLMLPIIFVALIVEWSMASILIGKVYETTVTVSLKNNETLFSIFRNIGHIISYHMFFKCCS